MSPESIGLIKIREYLYSTSPEKIDFDKTKKAINDLKKPFLNKPRILLKEYFERQEQQNKD